MSSENILIERLFQLSDDEIEKKIKDFLIEEQLPLLKKTIWVYQQVKQSSNKFSAFQGDINSFSNDYFNSWYKFYKIISSIKITEDAPWLNIDKTVVFSYHNFNYPLLSNYLHKQKIKILVASDSFWVKRIFSPSQIINFRSNQSIKILRSFIEGYSLFAMIDYCYQETRSIDSDFLGKKCTTPIGLIELAIRFKYKIIIAEIIDDKLVTHPITYGTNEPIGKVVDKINENISNRIISSPGDWLLWPSLDRRWNGYAQQGYCQNAG